jgi:hypothetical protein
MSETKKVTLFDRALARIEENIGKKHNCIPFGFKRFEEYLPGIIQKNYYILTANSSVGKSQITDSMFLYTPYNFVKNNKETDIKIKIFYFSLEMDLESKIIAGISKYIFEKYKTIIAPNQLNSIGKPLSQEMLKIVKEARQYFEELEDVTFITDDQLNPYHIYNVLNTYARENGKIVTKPVRIKDDQGNERIIEAFDYYIPNNPNEYVISICDHLAELSTIKGLDLKGVMELHSDHMRIVRNRYGYIPVDVQQQAASQESLQNFDLGKLEPSLNGLGETKLTQRKANIVLGLFAPNRFEIQNYRGYDISQLKDNYRNLSILKYRNGISNVNVGLYFNGACNYFAELPKADQMTKELYEKIKSVK